MMMKGLVQKFIDWLYRELKKKDIAVQQAVKWEPTTPREPVYKERHTDRIAMLSTLPMPRVPRCPPAPVPVRPAGPTTNVLRQYGHTYGGPKTPGARVRLYDQLRRQGKV